MSQLTVNVDMVAALREVKGLAEPDPAHAAVQAEMAGADGIAIQMRRSRRYIKDRDLYILKGVVKTKLTLEMPPVQEIVDKALEVKPWMVTLGADHADANGVISTVDLGAADFDFSDLVARFRGVGVHVGFFVEPDADQIRAVSKVGGAAVLLDCSGYSAARTIEQAQQELDRIDHAANAASKADLAVNLGRGINYRNIRPLVELGVVDEFVVGYSVCARAMMVGFERAVTEMIRCSRGSAE